VDPALIVTVRDFSSDTLRAIVAHLDVSTEFEHLVYREAELDAVWSITGFVLAGRLDPAGQQTVARLHAGAHRAPASGGRGAPPEIPINAANPLMNAARTG
jgi:hypothetical protein